MRGYGEFPPWPFSREELIMFSYKYNGDRDILEKSRLNRKPREVLHQCCDCGSTEDTRPVGPNTYLCRECLLKPVEGMDKISAPFGYTFNDK